MCAVPNMAVFCSSLTSWFPGMLLTYFLNDTEIVPVAPIFTGIAFYYYYYLNNECIQNAQNYFPYELLHFPAEIK